MTSSGHHHHRHRRRRHRLRRVARDVALATLLAAIVAAITTLWIPSTLDRLTTILGATDTVPAERIELLRNTPSGGTAREGRR